ncbi:hypothetical protein F4804DRAFT_340892 [Jackrogersella minutella]|nr:hypothetical protein F4804DRAFT_340892 [Jackrogersella minutella]
MANEETQDVYDDMEGYVRPTHWAKPYFSNHHHENPADTGMLGHVNCGYLSTPGRPPTLEALKQHAQSLTYLISTIVPNVLGAEVDNENLPVDLLTSSSFEENNAFDWLNNLKEPYDNMDKAHRKPLNSLVNLIKRNSDEKGVEFHCPLSEIPIQLAEKGSFDPRRPFQTHMTLLMHANECLERLDHEYSAMGGLLAILPTEQESQSANPDLPRAKETLIGQWLLYTQHLVGRMHELEIAYANSLDLLANEAIVPAQQMSAHGPDARSGSEIIFPQDRWILSNAGEDCFNFIHQMLDKKEAWSNSQDLEHIRQNVMGAALQERSGDTVTGRGIAHVDLLTRFYRLKNNGRGPIFVLPAFSDRPNTEYTREMENRPTVVTVTTPSLPGHTTAWDRRHREMEQTNSEQNIQLADLRKDLNNLATMNEAQTEELRRLNLLNRMYEDNQGKDSTAIATKMAAAEQARDSAQTQSQLVNDELNELRKELALYKQTTRMTQFPAPPDVTHSGDGAYNLNEAKLRQYESRSEAVLAAKRDIEKSRVMLQSLAAQGYLDLSTFEWMNQISNCA